MSKRYETEEAIWWAKERIDMLIETYQTLVDATTVDIADAKKKDNEYSEGIYRGQRMTYRLAMRDLDSLRRDIEAIEKAMA